VTTWSPSELAAVDGADELEIATRRADGTLRTARIVWVVRHGDELYVRSVNGRDAAYRHKYGRYPRPTARITAEAARQTTLRLDPA
jgi:hypothetical protein